MTAAAPSSTRESNMRRLFFALAMSATFLAPAAAQVYDHTTHIPGMNHAMLASSSPADGAILDQAPRALTLTFIHAVKLQTLTVTNANGVAVPVTWDRPTHPIPTHRIALPALASGAYRVSFTATGTGGIDTMPGVVRFTVR